MHRHGILFSKPTIISFLAILSIAGIAVYVIQTKEQGQVAGVCSAKSVTSTSFIKTFHLLDLTDGFDISFTKDGGYLLTGDILPASGMGAPKPYIIQTDTKGNPLWSRQFSSKSMALGLMSSRRIGRLALETIDGNIVTAIDVLDFVDENVKELYGDILVTKISKKGTQLWSLMLGDYSIDRPQKIWALSDGGVLLLARFMQTGYGTDVGDTDAVPKYSVLIKIDKNGKVQFAKKLNWEAEDVQYLADGSFIALANIVVPKTEQPENILGQELVPHALPTVIKLDSDFKVAWAKSLEMIPSEINAPTSYSGSSFTMGKTAIRMPGGDFRAVQPVPDGGFIAFGFGDLSLISGLMTGSANTINSFSARSLIAVKVDKVGNYKWAKKLTVNMTSSPSSNDFQVIKTLDDYFVIMQDVVRESAKVQAADFNLSPEALASNIELIKTDVDFNPMWVKKINAERDLSGYGIAPTADKGVVIASSMLTTKQHIVMMSLEPYKEAALIKVDVNGEVRGCPGVTDYRGATVEDQSSYLVMQSMQVDGAENMTLPINKKVKEKVFLIKNTARDICKYQKSSVAPNCSVSLPLTSGQTVTPPTPKTWALIGYGNTKEVAVDGEKNQAVHKELLPILNQIFNNQVKLKDSMKSMWLTYVFPRQVTRSDVEVVQKKYEELGYKIDQSEGGVLWVSKIGLTLHLIFSIQNSMVGKLEVLF